MKRKELSARALYALKRAVQTAVPTRHPALIVASFGRSGSTVLASAVTQAMARARFGPAARPARWFVRDWVLDTPGMTLRRGVVYHTHHQPHDVLSPACPTRVLFAFGTASDSILSVYGQRPEWIRQHFIHLGQPSAPERLLEADVLGYTGQCVAWMGCQSAPVLCVRYETMWDNVDRIAEFCGLPVVLPARRARAPKPADPRIVEKARAVHADLDAALASLPDIFVAAPEFAARVRAGAGGGGAGGAQPPADRGSGG